MSVIEVNLVICTRQLPRNQEVHLFGFTGTPIFAINSGTSKNPNLRTTAQAFGDQLHSYTIVDAINDKNVLPFRVDYIKTMDKEEDIEDVKVWDMTVKRHICPRAHLSCY